MCDTFEKLCRHCCLGCGDVIVCSFTPGDFSFSGLLCFWPFLSTNCALIEAGCSLSSTCLSQVCAGSVCVCVCVCVCVFVCVPLLVFVCLLASSLFA